MSVWRKKAIECLPELRKDFEQSATTIYDVFSEMVPAVVEAHQKNNIDKLEKIYAFAKWCFKQKEKDLWNAAGVAFYEHLADNVETFTAIPKWIDKELYRDIRPLLQPRVTDSDLHLLDEQYY